MNKNDYNRFMLICIILICVLLIIFTYYNYNKTNDCSKMNTNVYVYEQGSIVNVQTVCNEAKAKQYCDEYYTPSTYLKYFDGMHDGIVCVYIKPAFYPGVRYYE